MTYHAFNMFWFYLGFATVALGAAYSFYARGGKAFAREQKEEEAEKPAEAPAPYVMLSAEP